MIRYSQKMPHCFGFGVFCLAAAVVSSSLWAINVNALVQAPCSSLIANTQCKLNLDIGLEPGTWMPKRYPGWAESGARLGLTVDVEFSNCGMAERGEKESLVGPLEEMFQINVISRESLYVSEKGQESVLFSGGGWCVQRPQGDIYNSVGGRVKPEGLLRFWLDCKTGAKRQDVEIRPNTRIFFSTGLWDSSSPEDVSALKNEYEQIVDDLNELNLNELLDRTRRAKEEAASSVTDFGPRQTNLELHTYTILQ
jgi:hypothetical protein